MKTILIIDDDAAIIRGLREALTDEHFNVLSAGTGEKGLLLARRENVDLIILDLRLPDKNGEEICRELRTSGVNRPILMLTTKTKEMEKVVGLESGADDYVTKPFSVPELLARIRALLRRKWEMNEDLDVYAFGDVTVDFKKQEVKKGRTNVKLSTRECAVLKYLILHAGEVVTRDMLLDEVWGYEEFPVTRTVDNYILSLRKKLEDTPAHPRHLVTIHTTGYKFVK